MLSDSTSTLVSILDPTLRAALPSSAMSSLDDELAEIEQESAYNSPSNYGSTQTPVATDGNGAAASDASANGGTPKNNEQALPVAKVKASNLNSVGRGRRGSGFQPGETASGNAATTGSGGPSVCGNPFVNPKMTEQQKAALQAMLARNPGLAKYAPPGTFGPPPQAVSSGSSAPVTHKMGNGGASSVTASAKISASAEKKDSEAADGSSSSRGDDLLVGWGAGDDESNDDESGCQPQDEQERHAPPDPMRMSESGGDDPLNRAAELQSSADEEDEGMGYRPTVDAMAEGGEAERIMHKQNEMYDLQMPAHRTYVGGFAAAAYETAREYHYIRKAEEAEEAEAMKERLKNRQLPPSI